MISILENEDPLGYPFWIGNVLQVNTENKEVISVEIHWYATNTHPFIGGYDREMVSKK